MSETPTPALRNCSAQRAASATPPMVRVGDHALDGQAVVVAQVGGEEGGDAAGHAHRLFLQPFAHAAQAAVDGGADADLGHVAEEAVAGFGYLQLWHCFILFV